MLFTISAIDGRRYLVRSAICILILLFLAVLLPIFNIGSAIFGRTFGNGTTFVYYALSALSHALAIASVIALAAANASRAATIGTPTLPAVAIALVVLNGIGFLGQSIGISPLRFFGGSSQFQPGLKEILLGSVFTTASAAVIALAIMRPVTRWTRSLPSIAFVTACVAVVLESMMTMASRARLVDFSVALQMPGSKFADATTMPSQTLYAGLILLAALWQRATTEDNGSKTISVTSIVPMTAIAIAVGSAFALYQSWSIGRLSFSAYSLLGIPRDIVQQGWPFWIIMAGALALKAIHAKSTVQREASSK